MVLHRLQYRTTGLQAIPGTLPPDAEALLSSWIRLAGMKPLNIQIKARRVGITDTGTRKEIIQRFAAA